MNEWDPIGVKGIPGAHDEYDSYVSAIHKMLITILIGVHLCSSGAILLW